jgi:hypothetical protein
MNINAGVEPTTVGDATASTDVTCPAPAAGQLSARTESDEIHIPLVTEELRATVRPTEGGPVRVQRRVVQEDHGTESLTAADDIRVSRRIVTRRGATGGPTPFEQIVIELPLPAGYSIELRAQSEAEEIVVTHEIVHHARHIVGRVQREEIAVTADGAIDRVPAAQRADQ